MGCIVHGVSKSQTQLSDFHFHPGEWGGGRQDLAPSMQRSHPLRQAQSSSREQVELFFNDPLQWKCGALTTGQPGNSQNCVNFSVRHQGQSVCPPTLLLLITSFTDETIGGFFLYHKNLTRGCGSSKKHARGLPCGPVAKTPCPQCRGLEFDPWSGN